MEKELWNYRITPRVLKVNVEQTIEIEGLDDSYRFYDDVEYEIKILSRDEYSFEKGISAALKNNISTKIFQIKSKDGVLKFNYQFESEGLWRIYVRCLENKHYTEIRKHYWPWTATEKEFVFSVYALEEDLYGKFPYKGDLHMHTYGSDGEQSPALMAAKYRKYGFDFVSITDHYTMNPSLEAIKRFKEIPTNFTIFPGEEVHHPNGGLYVFHVVNFNGKESINTLLRNNLEQIEKEIEERAKVLKEETVDETEAVLVAWYEWIHQRIKAVDGITIYPHPYYEFLGVYNIRESTTREVYKRGLCDVVEIFGGTDKINNRLQAQLYYKMQSEGYAFPFVASSDAHGNVTDERFSRLWTIVFSENNTNKLPCAIKNGYTVAIEGMGNDEKTVYGDLRFVKYAWFLINEYYPRHDELCNAAGQAIERYVLGDREQKLLITLTEKEIEKYNLSFFGRI